MKEDGCDTYRTDKAYEEQPDAIEAAADRSPVGEFLFYDMLRHHPSYEDTCQQRA